MLFNNDHPPPHIHVRYGGANACVRIADGCLHQGKFPRKQLNLVKEWVLAHSAELLENWNLAIAHEEILQIEPLQ